MADAGETIIISTAGKTAKNSAAKLQPQPPCKLHRLTNALFQLKVVHAGLTSPRGVLIQKGVFANNSFMVAAKGMIIDSTVKLAAKLNVDPSLLQPQSKQVKMYALYLLRVDHASPTSQNGDTTQTLNNARNLSTGDVLEMIIDSTVKQVASHNVEANHPLPSHRAQKISVLCPWIQAIVKQQCQLGGTTHSQKNASSLFMGDAVETITTLTPRKVASLSVEFHLNHKVIGPLNCFYKGESFSNLTVQLCFAYF